MCRRQAAARQYSGPARGVTADVCIIEKFYFCQETYEMPIVSWKYSHELEAAAGVEGHVQAAGCRDAVQSSGNEASRVTADVYSEKDVYFCQETCETPIASWTYSHDVEG